jgi:prefoldin alpha subunit
VFLFSIVVVDIGTNFYVEKTRPEAIEFFDRKIKYVDENMEKIMPQMVQKNQSRNLVESEIVQKMKAAKLAKPSK